MSFRLGRRCRCGHRDQALEQRVELVDAAAEPRLQVERRLLRVDAGAEHVEHGVAGVVADRVDRLPRGPGGQHVQVRDDEEALVVVLQADAVLDGADVVAEVELAGGAVAGQHPLPGHLDRPLDRHRTPLSSLSTVGSKYDASRSDMLRADVAVVVVGVDPLDDALADLRGAHVVALRGDLRVAGHAAHPGLDLGPVEGLVGDHDGARQRAAVGLHAGRALPGLGRHERRLAHGVRRDAELGEGAEEARDAGPGQVRDPLVALDVVALERHVVAEGPARGGRSPRPHRPRRGPRGAAGWRWPGSAWPSCRSSGSCWPRAAARRCSGRGPSAGRRRR